MKSFITLIILILATPIYSQNTSSISVKGLIKDKSGKPIDQASISITELEVMTESNSFGEFIFRNISPNFYHFLINRNGYKSLLVEISIDKNDTSISLIIEESIISVPVIDVTSSFNAMDISASTYAVSEINQRELYRVKNQNLAEAIQNTPGINNISTGSTIGKPVIRGLSFQRVLIVHDNVKHESQSWGDEHGPELSLFDLNRIEILRGPASMVYGAEGIAGVINLISNPLQFSNTKPLFYGDIKIGSNTVNNRFFTNALLGFGTKYFGIKGYAGFSKSDNIKTPDGTFSVHTFEGMKILNGGVLWNSGSKEIEAGLNAGIMNTRYNVHFSSEIITRELELHDEDPNESGNQKLFSGQLAVQGNFVINQSIILESVFSYQLQNRKEYESIDMKTENNPEVDLKTNTFNGTLHLHYGRAKGISGTFGTMYEYQTNGTFAEEKLIPNSGSSAFGIFYSSKYSANNFTLSGGIRFDSKNLNIKETVFETDSLGTPTLTINPQTINFKAMSGSLGIAYLPINEMNFYMNFGTGWRPPSEFELFVNGIHEGAGRYEIGLKTSVPDYQPKPELSVNLDAGLRLNYKKIHLQFSGFRNIINNFIFPAPTTDTIDGVSVYHIRQSKSIFTGFEYHLQFQLLNWLLFSIKGDFVNSKNYSTGNSLPFTPPMKNIIDFRIQKKHLWKFYNLYGLFSAKIVSPQNNVDPLESKTDGYTIFTLGAGFEFYFSNSLASLDVSVENLTNVKYVDHLSRFKGYALNPGLGLNIKLSIPFSF